MDLLLTVVLFVCWLDSTLAVDAASCTPISHLKCDCSVVQKNVHRALIVDCKGKLQNGEIPDFTTIKDMPINRLDLRSNKITEIKSDMLGLNFVHGHIEEEPVILLGDNAILDISPRSFRGIRGDVIIKLDNCGLRELPLAALREIKGLTKLYINKNKIDTIPARAFADLKKLISLTLNENPIGDVDIEAFDGLEKSLEELNLAHTDQTIFPSQALQGLSKLKEVSLNRNHITSLPALIFENFTAQTDKLSINLDENRMTDIDIDAFKRNGTSMSVLDLRLWDNDLTDVDFLKDPCSLVFHRKASVDMAANPMICDCDFYDIAQMGFYNIDGRCEGPAEFNQIKFDVLHGSDLYPFKTRYTGDFGSKAEKACAGENQTQPQPLSCVTPVDAKTISNAPSLTVSALYSFVLTWALLKGLIDLF